MMQTLSLALAVHNEEKFLEKCLNSVKSICDEIVVVDGSSTDSTVSIAKKFRSKIIATENRPNFHINKKMAIESCKKDWILQLDADEIVSEGLKEEIIGVLSVYTEINGYWIPRKNYFLGKFLKKGGVYPDYTLRLYKNGKGNLPAESVHEQARVYGEVGYLKNDLLHYSNPRFSDYVSKRFIRYSKLMAEDVNGGFLNYFLLKPLFDQKQGFFSIFVKHLGFMDGFPGFVWALFSALHFPMAYIFSRESKK